MSCFSLLPEGCITDIISLTSPKDACRASAISSAFKSAAESDIVWEKFLPSDYPEIISRSVSPVVYSTKKELYFLLCNSPILLDESKLVPAILGRGEGIDHLYQGGGAIQKKAVFGNPIFEVDVHRT